MFDHYPFDSAMLIAQPPPPARKRPPIISRYGVDFCSVCSLMLEYCRCDLATPDEQSGDARAESDLGKRIRAVKR